MCPHIDPVARYRRAVADSTGAGKTRSFLTADHQQPRVRRAASVTTVAVGALFMLWGALVFEAQDPLQKALTAFADALPEWAVAVLAFGYTLGLLYALVLIVVFVARRRWSALRDVVVAVAIAAVIALGLAALNDGLWPQFFTEFVHGEARPQFPVVRVAVVVAVLVAATPYLARPMRRLGWTIVVIISLAALALGLSVPAGVVVGLGAGLVSAGAVMLIFGSPVGYPDVAGVTEALGRIGVHVPDLQIAPDQSWGVRRLTGTTAEGVRVEVKAYGRDAMDSQLAAKAWRALLYRGAARQLTFSRIQSVEHEALVTMMAGRADVTVPSVLAAAAATDEVALLVTSQSGTALAELLEPDRWTDDQLVALWNDVGRMHAAGITHGALTAEAVRVTDSGHEIAEWGSGAVVYRDSDSALDIVHLLFATAQAVGVERAVAAAADALGPEGLAASLGYLQPPALSARERRSAKGAGKQLKALRDEVARVTDTPIPEPVKLRRLDAKTVITLVLVLMFASALIPLLTGIDYSEIWSSLSNATWWIAACAVLAGQVAFLPQGTSMMSAVGRAIPLRPMTILQPAVAFISFAVPGMAGRVTMESAFLYKYGIPPTVSVTKGAVDAFGGFLVQLTLLITAFLTGALTLAPGSTTGSTPTAPSWAVIVLIVAVALAVVIVVWRVDTVHNRVVPELKKAWAALAEVLKSPRLALGLLGSQLAVQLLWGLALWLALLSLGVHLSLITCTAVVVATSLLQGLIPVPGGIGVSEAVMSAFLVPLGVPGAVAVGATVIWRVATFYLPATEGFFAARHLQKRGYL